MEPPGQQHRYQCGQLPGPQLLQLGVSGAKATAETFPLRRSKGLGFFHLKDDFWVAFEEVQMQPAALIPQKKHIGSDLNESFAFVFRDTGLHLQEMV